MFAIIISEKGGAERKESFDKNEINVGRVQGNDLMLPKGNVSKHHARLLFRDGRFIVTDLKSTNGTYVNGRKIAQATIVREGDKIYIGDFVLRLETNGASGSVSGEPPPPADDEQGRTAARPNPPGPTLKAPTHPPGAPIPRAQPLNVSTAQPPPMQASAPLGGPPPLPGGPGPAAAGGSVSPSEFPVGDESDDSNAQVAKPVRPVPAAPGTSVLGGGGGARPATMPLNQMSPAPLGIGLQRPATSPPPAAAPAAPAVGPTRPAGPADAAAAPAPAPAPAPALFATPGRATAPPPRVPPKETPEQAGRRLALMTLLDRIADAVDLSPLRVSPTLPEGLAQQVERAAREQADAMRDEGDAPEGVDLAAVARDAQRELTGLGPFGPLLDDEAVSEINAVRFDQIFTVRSGVLTPEATAFSSEEALQRVVARLVAQSGDPWKPGEAVIERRLARASFVAIAPPASAGHVVSIRKRLRIETSLGELAGANVLSAPMAQFLEACVAMRANVLVSGSAPLPMLSALAAVGNGSERVVVVQDVEEIAVSGQPHAVNLSIADTRQLGEECVRAAAKLRPERLVVTQLAGGVAAGTIHAMAEGADGVLAGVPAPSLRQGMARLTAQLVLHRPGLALDAMREVIGESFDLAIEIGALADGRLRVTRIAELGGTDAKGIVARDVFLFNADAAQGGGEGAFSPTGVVPRIAGDLAARGLKLDPSMFKRAGR